MTFSLIFWSIAAAAMFIVLPIVMIRSMVQHLRTPASKRPGSGGVSAGVGAALRELDRMIARPSVEHQVDTEQRVLKREDDQGGN